MGASRFPGQDAAIMPSSVRPPFDEDEHFGGRPFNGGLARGSPCSRGRQASQRDVVRIVISQRARLEAQLTKLSAPFPAVHAASFAAQLQQRALAPIATS